MAAFDLFARQPPAFRLAGERIYLRPPRLSDWAAWRDLRLASRQFLQPWEPSWDDEALSRAAFRRRLARYAEDWQRDEGYSLFIIRRATDQLLGGIALSSVRRGVAESASIGYWIGEAHARNGYMAGAMNLALILGFERLGLHRIEAACLPQNEPSRAVLRGAGFQEEGCAREYLCIDGAWRDHLLYALLRREWNGPGAESGEAGELEETAE